jgi:6-phosphogluconolactonase (cycloisomerase 2 family)
MGVYSDATTANITTTVTWASSTPATATISNAANFDGLATAVAPGTTTITATLGTIVSPGVTLTVTHGALVSIAVTPATPSIAKGLTQQFTATGTYADASTANITSLVTWASGTPATATISNAVGTDGLATSLAIGTTSITATLGTVVSPAVTLNVTAATLVSIAVTPATPSIAKGLTQQFVAMGTYTDATVVNITTTVTWASATPATATISNTAPNKGLATSLAVGTTVITATSGTVVSPGVTLTVTAAVLESIAVTPANPSVFNYSTEQFTANGTYSDATVVNITTSVTWTSGTTATATISNAGGSNGLATALAIGTTSITAASGAITSPAQTLTVTAAEFLYVTDAFNGRVWQYDIHSDGTLHSMTPAFVPTDVNPNGLAVDPTHHHVYVANINTADVSEFTINANGTLAVMATPTVAAGAGANAVTIDAAGSHAYVPNSNAGTVSQYNIAGDGTLTPMTPAFVTGTTGAAVMAISPTSPTNAYVANYSGNSVSHFTISPTTGALTFVADVAITNTGTAPTPNSVIVDPSGLYLYVADPGNATIGQFAIDQTTGALTPLANAYVAQGSHSLTQLVKGGHTNVYTPNSGTDTLVHFEIGAGGDLGTLIDSVGPTAAEPISIVFDPSGNFAYSADYNGSALSLFTVNATGSLAAQTTPTIAVGTNSNPAYMVTTTAN